MLQPSNPQNGLDLIATFIGGCVCALVLYIIINVIIQGSILLARIFL